MPSFKSPILRERAHDAAQVRTEKEAEKAATEREAKRKSATEWLDDPQNRELRLWIGTQLDLSQEEQQWLSRALANVLPSEQPTDLDEVRQIVEDLLADYRDDPDAHPLLAGPEITAADLVNNTEFPTWLTLHYAPRDIATSDQDIENIVGEYLAHVQNSFIPTHPQFTIRETQEFITGLENHKFTVFSEIDTPDKAEAFARLWLRQLQQRLDTILPTLNQATTQGAITDTQLEQFAINAVENIRGNFAGNPTDIIPTQTLEGELKRLYEAHIQTTRPEILNPPSVRAPQAWFEGMAQQTLPQSEQARLNTIFDGLHLQLQDIATQRGISHEQLIDRMANALAHAERMGRNQTDGTLEDMVRELLPYVIQQITRNDFREQPDIGVHTIQEIRNLPEAVLFTHLQYSQQEQAPQNTNLTKDLIHHHDLIEDHLNIPNREGGSQMTLLEYRQLVHDLYNGVRTSQVEMFSTREVANWTTDRRADFPTHLPHLPQTEYADTRITQWVQDSLREYSRRNSIHEDQLVSRTELENAIWEYVDNQAALAFPPAPEAQPPTEREPTNLPLNQWIREAFNETTEALTPQERTLVEDVLTRMTLDEETATYVANQITNIESRNNYTATNIRDTLITVIRDIAAERPNRRRPEIVREQQTRDEWFNDPEFLTFVRLTEQPNNIRAGILNHDLDALRVALSEDDYYTIQQVREAYHTIVEQRGEVLTQDEWVDRYTNGEGYFAYVDILTNREQLSLYEESLLEQYSPQEAARIHCDQLIHEIQQLNRPRITRREINQIEINLEEQTPLELLPTQQEWIDQYTNGDEYQTILQLLEGGTNLTPYETSLLIDHSPAAAAQVICDQIIRDIQAVGKSRLTQQEIIDIRLDVETQDPLPEPTPTDDRTPEDFATQALENEEASTAGTAMFGNATPDAEPTEEPVTEEAPAEPESSEEEPRASEPVASTETASIKPEEPVSAWDWYFDLQNSDGYVAYMLREEPTVRERYENTPYFLSLLDQNGHDMAAALETLREQMALEIGQQLNERASEEVDGGKMNKMFAEFIDRMNQQTASKVEVSPLPGGDGTAADEAPAEAEPAEEPANAEGDPNAELNAEDIEALWQWQLDMTHTERRTADYLRNRYGITDTDMETTLDTISEALSNDPEVSDTKPVTADKVKEVIDKILNQ